MSLLHPSCLYLLLHICLLSCSAGANVLVTMNETMEVHLGDPAQIHCHYRFLNKNPGDFLVMWFVNDSRDPRLQIYCADRTEVIFIKKDYSGGISVTNQHEESVLTIHKVQLSDEREFICQIYAFADGYKEAITSLRVFAAPQAPVIKGITTGISVTNVEPSEIASCQTRNGFPRPNITWYRNGVPMVQTPGLVDMKITGSVSHGLHTIQNTLFYKVDKKDMDANFACEVTYRVPGSIRTIMSNSINITVYYLDPAVMVPEESEVILVGEDLTASCNALSSLKTTTVWYKNGKEVGEGTTLHLKDATFESTGEYLCVVTVPSLPALRTSGSVHIIVQVPTTAAPGSSAWGIAEGIAEGSGVIIVVIILSLLLLLATVTIVFCFLHKKGKIPFVILKKEMTKETTTNDDVIVEMTNFTKKEESLQNFTKREDSLIANSVNGDNRGPNDQGDGAGLIHRSSPCEQSQC